MIAKYIRPILAYIFTEREFLRLERIAKSSTWLIDSPDAVDITVIETPQFRLYSLIKSKLNLLVSKECKVYCLSNLHMASFFDIELSWSSSS